MNRPVVVLLAYAVLSLIVLPVFPHFVSPNEMTRWLLAAAIVEKGSVEVSAFAPMLGPRMEDLAEIDGRLVSNKAPGAAFAGLPGYLAVRPFTGPPAPSSIRPMVTAMRLFASTLPLLALGWMMIRYGRSAGASEERIAFVLAVVLFGTPLFAYGLLLFSHALVAAALFGAWLFLRERRDATAGALIGLAVVSEYTAAVPAAILLFSLLPDWRRFLRAVAAGLPFALLLALYHHAAYGSIFGLPYGHDTLPQFRSIAQRGIAGVSFPTPAALTGLMVHPGKGLVVFSPILLLSLVGKRHWTLIAVPASILLVSAGYANWHGGWSVGPRYILAAVPFLAAPLMLGERLRIEGVLLGWSLAAVVPTALVFPFVPNAFVFPWMSFAAPLLGAGLVAPNLLHLVARPLAIAVPLAIAACTPFLASGSRRAPWILIGVFLAIIAGTREPSDAERTQRAYIASVYFERDSREPMPPGLAARREYELQLPPSSWPF